MGNSSQIVSTIPNQVTQEAGKIAKGVVQEISSILSDIPRGVSQKAPDSLGSLSVQEILRRKRKERGDLRRLRRRIRAIKERQTQFRRNQESALASQKVKDKESTQKEIIQLQRKREAPLAAKRQWVERKAGFGGG